MLYSIIPPILIILSLAGIIVLFAKKSNQLASLGDEDELEREKNRLSKARKTEKMMQIIGRVNWMGLLSWPVVFLGNQTKKIGRYFAELKKDDGKRENVYAEDYGDKKNEEEAVLEKINQYKSPRKSYLAEMKNVLKKEKNNKREKTKGDDEEKIIKPMVSDRVVNPNNRVEMKDRLEDLLIERIAANPRDIEAYERLGEYYMEIDSLHDAKECFKQVLKLDSKNRNVKYRMRALETMMHR